MQNSSEKLSIWQKLGYGVGDFYGGGAGTLISFFYLVFLTDVVRLSPGLAGAVILVSFTFREVGRLQKRLDRQLVESRLQLQRQAVLVQLSLKLAPTLDEERIANQDSLALE